MTPQSRAAQRVAPEVGEAEDPGWPPPPAAAVDALLARLDGALPDQQVEVASHRGRREVEPLGQRGGRGGAVLEDRPRHALTRGSVGDGAATALEGAVGEFHNASVTLMGHAVQARVP